MKSELAISSGGYIDYYDHHFCSRLSAREQWKRNNRVFPTRSEGFTAMQCAGVITVEFDTVQNMCVRKANEDILLVVYTDELSHQGFGKKLMYASLALNEYPDALCSVYYESVDKLAAESLRELAVGDRLFLQKCVSENDWRSNVNTTSFETLLEITECPNHGWNVSKIPQLMCRYKSPIFAIDYVFDKDAGLLRACDMNLAPGMRGTGIEKMLPPKVAAELIERSYWDLLDGTF